MGMLSAPQGGCSSISLASCINTSGPKSLLALGASAGKGGSINMTSCWYGYNNFQVTPTTIVNIPAAGGIVCATACGPAANAYQSGGGYWSTILTLPTLSPSGVNPQICVYANTGGARAENVSLQPNACSADVKYICLCQIAATTTTTAAPSYKPVCFQNIYTCDTGVGGCCALACIQGNPISSECYNVCLQWYLSNNVGKATSSMVSVYNGAFQYCVCSLSNLTKTCSGTWCITSINGASCWMVCTLASSIPTFGGSSIAEIQILSVTPVNGSFCRGTPYDQASYGGSPPA
jgi:hypothetical protein